MQGDENVKNTVLVLLSTLFRTPISSTQENPRQINIKTTK